MFQDIEYNGFCGSELEVYIQEMPSIPAAKKKRESVKIPGRDGVLYLKDAEYEETEIKVLFNYIGRAEKWTERWRKIQRWLSAERSTLSFSDDPEVFYKISYVTLGENKRKSQRIGNFEAVFKTQDGICYAKAGTLKYPKEDVLQNPYGMSKPLYIITGEGLCTLQVNGNCMKANVGQNLTIDTDRMLSYREDGRWTNTDVEGDYESLYLKAGENTIEITDGFGLEVVPNWRCI